MLDDFFTRAILAGIGVALVAGPLGCFVIWRKMAYLGDTLAHSALLGVAVALLLQINVMFAVFVISILVSLLLLVLQKRGDLSSDALLGLLSHSTLAIGLVVLALVSWIRVDLNGLLFGDILSVSKTDLGIIAIGGLTIIGILKLIWHPLFAATVNREIALAEGGNPDRVNLVYMILLAAVIAISMKIVGALLITALLIIPAATARRLSNTPVQMVFFASAVGVIGVVFGLFGSLQWDTPSGPSIVVASAFLFAFVTLLSSIHAKYGNYRKGERRG
jgi:zinc transport system permease protein